MEKYSSDYSYYGNVYRKSADGSDVLVEENAMLEYYDETFKFAFLSDAMAYIFSLAYDKEEDNKVAENILNSRMFSCDRNTTNNGFYKYSKVLTGEEMDEMAILADNMIDKAIDGILDCDFDINPKVINGENVSCSFCEYRDICYLREKDKVYINKDGEDNGD